MIKNGHNFEKFIATIKSMDVIFFKSNVSATFNKKLSTVKTIPCFRTFNGRQF